jgi:alpha-beta hydrolase superfamily lysophospholipase
VRTGVLVVHGIGEQSEREFALTFIAEMRRRLAERGVAAGDVVFGRGYWADLLNAREHALLAQMARGGPLAYRDLRGFVVNALGDAVAYRRGTADRRNLYYDVHARILAHLRALRAALGGADAPLVVVAHSLGSVIASDFIWDAQHPERGCGVAADAAGGSDFERMRTLAGLVTFGSNIPLFTLALPKVVAIAPPRASPALAPAVRSVAEWHNYYDADDVLGWPLRSLEAGAPLGAGEWAYADAVDADHAINVGGALAAWNPLSHSAYWRDGDFLGPAAAQIAAVARAARGAG